VEFIYAHLSKKFTTKKGDSMNKIELLSESKLLVLAVVLAGIALGLSVFATGSADPWNPWPWP
jgi:hypothetical protein